MIAREMPRAIIEIGYEAREDWVNKANYEDSETDRNGRQPVPPRDEEALFIRMNRVMT